MLRTRTLKIVGRSVADAFLAVPYLMDQDNKWPKATMWKTAIKTGGISVVDDDGNIISTEDRYRYIIEHMEQYKYTVYVRCFTYNHAS